MTRSKNSINPVDVLASISWGESQDLEFKSAQGGIPRDLWETYSALANTQGGVILPPSIDTVHGDRHSLHKEQDSLHKEENSLHNGLDSLHIAEITNEQWSNLERLASPAIEHKRLTHKEMESIILTICKDQWLTRRQISELIQRNPEGVLTRFLTPMVEHSFLQLRYPDKPNRTDQAYRTARKLDQNNKRDA